MNDFVEQCRREWKRLRVPDAVAEEMAADLEADLREAEAEGASAEDVLGSGAADPRSFAASWATARGVIPPATPGVPRRALVLAAIAALTAVTVVGASLVVFASPRASEPTAVRILPVGAALVAARAQAEAASAVIWAARPPGPGSAPVVTLSPDRRVIARFDRDGRVLLTDVDAAGVEIHRVGSILLIAGLAGIIPALLLLLWSTRPRLRGP